MAERNFFYIKDGTIQKRSAEFEWFPGFAVTQKQKSIQSFHNAIREKGFVPLEVSTKSLSNLGKKLSAFSLKLNNYPLECVFQSSKVFEKGGPYDDLLLGSPKDAKRDDRLRTSGNLKHFEYEGSIWELEPKTLFYDWLYYKAVKEALSKEELEELCQYNAFTDIEYNANKSLNTQARSAALVTLIYQRYNNLPDWGRQDFLNFHCDNVSG